MASPWHITVDLDDAAGWERTFCLVCTHTYGTKTLDEITIKQFSSLQSNVCGWKKVRHLPAGSIIWYSSKDQMQGTDTFGDPTNDLLSWSIPFSNDAYN